MTINNLFEICLFPLLCILSKYLITFIQIKNEELKQQMHNNTSIKYSDMITETIVKCVITTNQTYVSTLKAQNKFDAAAQEEAFKRTYEAVNSLLNEELKQYIEEVYGDIEIYLKQTIEFVVSENK